MAIKRGHEIPTIDVELVTLTLPGQVDELALNTASKVALTPQVETQEAIKLIVKARLIAQKPTTNTLTGNQIVLTDNVMNPELLVELQGGTITYDTEDPTKIVGYQPPVAGSTETGSIFTLNLYSAIYDEAGVIKGHEKTAYPNCQGTPYAPSAEDNVFRISEYTINSAPGQGEAPYAITYLGPDELPVIPAQPALVFGTAVVQP